MIEAYATGRQDRVNYRWRQGIGRSIALAYAREGARVAVVARTGSELDEVAGEIRKLGQNGLRHQRRPYGSWRCQPGSEGSN